MDGTKNANVPQEDFVPQRKPGKKLARLQLDADLLAWFKD